MSAEICPACGQPRPNAPSAGPCPSCAASPAGGPPERIFLQWPGTEMDERATWCSDRINDDDHEYVLAAVAAHHRAEAREWEAACLTAEAHAAANHLRAERAEAALREMEIVARSSEPISSSWVLSRCAGVLAAGPPGGGCPLTDK